MKTLKYLPLIICFFSFFSFFSSANTTLLFIVNFPGSPPYLYFNKKHNTYVGVIPDILKGLTDERLLNIKYISNSRKRSEESLYQGKADLMMLSKHWLREPDKLISTIPLHQHRSFLYQLNEFSYNFSLDNIVDNNLICTRKGFNYPSLEPYFKSNKLIRVDALDQLSMLKMLFKKRCDYTILNEFNYENLINLPHFKGQVPFRSNLPTSNVPLNIILRPELTREKKLLDNHINDLIRSGEFERILKKHTQH